MEKHHSRGVFFCSKGMKINFTFKKSITFESKFIKMKHLKYTILLALCFSMQIQAQNQSDLSAHYQGLLCSDATTGRYPRGY